MNTIEQQIDNLQEQIDALKQQLAEQTKHEKKQDSLLQEGVYYLAEDGGSGFEGNGPCDVSQKVPNSFQSGHISQAYAKAFETFLLLRHQPGTVKAEDGIQWLIRAREEGGVYSDNFWCDSYKVDYISPCFKTKEHAEAAIQTIGEEQLMQMFNTFHGIY